MRTGFLLTLAFARMVFAGTAQNTFSVELSPAPAPTELRPDSPFGINTAFLS